MNGITLEQCAVLWSLCALILCFVVGNICLGTIIPPVRKYRAVKYKERYCLQLQIKFTNIWMFLEEDWWYLTNDKNREASYKHTIVEDKMVFDTAEEAFDAAESLNNILAKKSKDSVKVIDHKMIAIESARKELEKENL